MSSLDNTGPAGPPPAAHGRVNPDNAVELIAFGLSHYPAHVAFLPLTPLVKHARKRTRIRRVTIPTVGTIPEGQSRAPVTDTMAVTEGELVIRVPASVVDAFQAPVPEGGESLKPIFILVSVDREVYKRAASPIVLASPITQG